MTTKRALLLPLMLLAAGLAVFGCNKSDSASAAKKYHCPMHPTYVSDKPGECPICNMKLVLIKNDKTAAKPAMPAADDKIAQVKPGQFYCPMKAEHVQDTPGECPKCGMKLIEKKASEGGHEGHEGHGASAAPTPTPGRIAITLSPEKKQMIGLTTAVVEKRDLIQTIRTTARFEHDETTLARIAPRFSGWVEELKINFTGQHVEKGEPLLTVYSPELYTAETEYLTAFQHFEQLKKTPSDPQSDSAHRVYESAQRKLKLWEIGEPEIRDLERTGQPRDELLLRSPVSGHVVTKTAIAGRAFQAGETLYEIADLTHLWLRGYVFEFEFPLIKVGQKARVVLPYLGNTTYESSVKFIYPHIDPSTRRAEIRLEVANPKQELRPDMWANVELDVSYGEVLSVPTSALIDTGVRHVAFVLREGDKLEPREVKIGSKTDDYYEVREGLSAGDKVVVRALFLVDSESQLKAAISGMDTAGGRQH